MNCQCGAMINNIPEWLSDAAPVACRDCQARERITQHVKRRLNSWDSFQLRGSSREIFLEKCRRAAGRPKAHDVPKGMKYCPKCDTPKPLDEFGRNAKRYDGKAAYCLACCRVIEAARRAKRRMMKQDFGG